MTLLTLEERSWNRRRAEGRLPAQRNRLGRSPSRSLTFVSWPVDAHDAPFYVARYLREPVELRKGRSESVAADLSVMKLMPNATGGCGPVFLHGLSRSFPAFLFSTSLRESRDSY